MVQNSTAHDTTALYIHVVFSFPIRYGVCPTRVKMENLHTKSSLDGKDLLVPYMPPEWAADLKGIPQYRVNVSVA